MRGVMMVARWKSQGKQQRETGSHRERRVGKMQTDPPIQEGGRGAAIACPRKCGSWAGEKDRDARAGGKIC